jgi:hypothetical protein
VFAQVRRNLDKLVSRSRVGRNFLLSQMMDGSNKKKFRNKIEKRWKNTIKIGEFYPWSATHAPATCLHQGRYTRHDVSHLTLGHAKTIHLS